MAQLIFIKVQISSAGTGEGNPRNSANAGAGVYRSLDGGHTFQFMGLENTRNIHRIIIHPDDPNTVALVHKEMLS